MQVLQSREVGELHILCKKPESAVSALRSEESPSKSQEPDKSLSQAKR